MHQVPFPLVADEKGEIAAKIGMLDASQDKRVTVRGVFVIDPSKKVKVSRTEMSGDILMK